MKVLIYYVDFHWDNHQGGSGKNYEMRYSLDIPDEIPVVSIRKYCTDKLADLVEKQRPFIQDNSCSINRIEII